MQLRPIDLKKTASGSVKKYSRNYIKAQIRHILHSIEQIYLPCQRRSQLSEAQWFLLVFLGSGTRIPETLHNIDTCRRSANKDPQSIPVMKFSILFTL